MTEGRTKRKLSAILSADVKGYSILMADDEAATVKTLTAYRDLISSLTRKHQGRVVDSPGDNILALSSAVWWMRYAVPWRFRKSFRPGTLSYPKTAGWISASVLTWGTLSRRGRGSTVMGST